MRYKHVAQSYYEAGWLGVLPLPAGKKFPPPSGYTGYGTPMPSLEGIEEWCQGDRANGNVGLRMPVTVLCIDVDHGYVYESKRGKGTKDGLDSFQSLVDRLGKLPDTWRSTSRLNGEGQGSAILLFKVPADIRWHEKHAGGDIELISHNHRYIVAWPSIHPDTGQTYRWLKPDGTVAPEGEFPRPDELPELPDAWVKALSTPKKVKSAWELPAAGPKDVEKLLTELQQLAEGTEVGEGRNNQLNKLAWRLGQLIPGGLIDEKSVRDKLWSAAVDSGLVNEDGEGKVLATITSGLSTGIDDPRRASATQSRSMTDVGNGQRFADRYGGEVMYVHSWGSWLVWDGSVWKTDSGGVVWRMAKDTARAITAEMGSATTDGERDQLLKWYSSSQFESRLKAMLSMAQSEHVISRDNDKFDANPDLFNAANGVVDLRTGELMSHSPEHMMTKISAHKYEPGAQCPRFMQFLKTVFDGDDDLIAYVQRIIGYSLTGRTDEHKMFVLWGNGRNGKSTLLDIMLALAGQYGTVSDPEIMLASANARSGVDIAVLEGARMVSCNETDATRYLAEARVKSMTGGDAISARHLYSKPFQFKPRFKLWLATNYRPRVRGGDDGIWRRLVLVPFNVQIPASEVEKGLGDKLLFNEGPGILAWAVRGAVDWYKHEDLGEPEAIKGAVAEYRGGEDTFAEFVRHHCDTDTTYQVGSQTLRTMYNEWCKTNGEFAPNPSNFKNLVASHGYQHKVTNKGSLFLGIKPRLG